MSAGDWTIDKQLRDGKRKRNVFFDQRGKG